MPLGKANIANKIKMTRNKIFMETGKNASIKEIAKLTNLDEKTIKKISKEIVKTVSMEETSYTNKQEKVQLGDFLADEDFFNPQTLYYRERVQDSIEKSLEKLPSRAAYIVKEYFGLEGHDNKNFAQIAEELGLSRERVRQIQKKSLQKILKDTYKEAENDIDYLIQENL